MNVGAAMLDTQDLEEYSLKFYGFGNPGGKLWFIGLEEAGGKCERVVADRLHLWKHRFASAPIIDGLKFHTELMDCEGNSLKRLFEAESGTQATWNQLIRLQLAWNGSPNPQKLEISKFLAQNWAQADSDNCLLELFPLPSPSVTEWHYPRWSDADFLKSREKYHAEFRSRRVDGIRALIKEHGPKAVVFYGRTRLRCWSEIAGFRWRDVADIRSAEPLINQQGQTCYCVVSHPAARGTKSESFLKTGRMLCEKCL